MSAGKKPNILILWGDDIGWYNLSCHNQGAMGYRTPNIDRVAREGIDFIDKDNTWCVLFCFFKQKGLLRLYMYFLLCCSEKTP